MHVVRHQAVRPYLNFALGRLLAQKVEVDGMIPVLEKDRHAPVAALGDMVSASRNYDSCKTGHGLRLEHF